MIWRSPRRVFAAIALVLTIAPLAASAPLFDPDEGLHAAIAQEMILRHDYVTPTFLGEPFLDKPILFFWCEAASLRLFGMHADAVRLPPLLFGVLGMIGVALLGRSLFGEAAGLIAGICYGSMLLPLGVSEVAVHDVALASFICLAALALARASADGRIARWGAIAGIALGLSILTKGLVGIAFTGIFALCLAAVRRTAIWRIGWVLAIAVALAVLVAAPWYIAMEHAHPGYLRYYFVERHLHGYLTATQRHAGRPWWYYAPIIVGGALPWTLYVAAAAARARAHPMLAVLWGWLALGLVFLSAGESKLITYALPLFVPIALLVGEYVVNRDRGSGQMFRWAFAVHAGVLALFPAAALLAVSHRFAPQPAALWVAVTASGALVLVAAVQAWRSSTDEGLLGGYLWMTAIAAVALLGLVVPRAATWMTARDLAQALNRSDTLPPRVSVLDERIGSLVFYLSPALRTQAAPDRFADVSVSQALGAARIDPPDAVIAVRNNQLDRLARVFAGPLPAAERAGTFTLFRAGQIREALSRR